MPSDHVTLVCLPFAGAGASFFRAWRKLPSPGVEVAPLQLPGREEQFHRSPFTDVADAVKELTPQVLERTAHSSRVALFGHSLGAVLAYEVARELERGGHPAFGHLVVSGSPPPWAGRRERTVAVDDEEFLRRVQDFAGYRHEAFDDPDLRELLLPTLRADVTMHESYRPSDRRPLAVPVTVLRGAEDTLVSREEAEEWRHVTTGPFTYTEPPGGHMYLADTADPVLHAAAAGTPAVNRGEGDGP
ncbi:thioesterase II family protein [Streptomyces sp. NPDC090106]|uniref:thioesterase II family protein n=1 Tax=Streptomyces sp. NPDC090106 TaxID=3365946 RepID=UPI00382B7C91